MRGRVPRHEILLTRGAEQDLDSLHDYLSASAGVAKADQLLDRLLEVVEGLAKLPERGSYPKELVALGIKEYRQTSFKPYRVIYRVVANQVLIYLIVDGRREMQPLLARRLFGA